MRFFLTIISLAFFVGVYAQKTYTDKRGNEHLWGSITLEDLQQDSHREWFDEQYQAYTPRLNDQLKTGNLEELQVKIFLGTWCGDTRYLVPRFVKLWQALGLDTDALSFTALHNKGDLYKRGPNGEEEGLNIHRVPTFIFEREGKEVGRIVERTLNTLETDLTQIAVDCPSEPRYRAVNYLHEQFQTTEPDSLYVRGKEVIRAVYREVAGSGELNTYGYVLKAAGRLEQAEFVFFLNTRLFPYDPNVYDSLGELYVAMEAYEKAKNCYDRVLKIKTGR